MPFTLKKVAMRLRNNSEYIPLPGVRGDEGPTGPAGPGVPAGGTAGQVLAKSSNTDYATTWVNAGGGGTSDYDDLTDKPSINGTTLSGNKTAADLGLGTYSKPSGGIPSSDLASAVQTSLGKADSALQAVPSTYRTATDQDSIDATQDAAIGIVITGKRPSMTVTAGQYVIVRNSTISGITDGLYTANAALSPSTDVTAANLSAVSAGGLNSLISSRMPIVQTYSIGSEAIAAGGMRTISYTIPSISGYTPRAMSVHIPDTSNVNYAKVFLVWNNAGTTINAHIFNTSTGEVRPSPYVECIYLHT